MRLTTTLKGIEAELEPILSAIYGVNAHCRSGSTFLYIWWGEGYSVHSQRYSKKQATEVLEQLRPIIGFE
jgi:hypothetical protein